jgi:hypothetical protein
MGVRSDRPLSAARRRPRRPWHARFRAAPSRFGLPGSMLRRAALRCIVLQGCEMLRCSAPCGRLLAAHAIRSRLRCSCTRRPPSVALACKGPLNARLATGVGLSFFLSTRRPPRGPQKLGLSAAHLKTTFTAMSSTLTSLRTTVAGGGALTQRTDVQQASAGRQDFTEDARIDAGEPCAGAPFLPAKRMSQRRS